MSELILLALNIKKSREIQQNQGKQRKTEFIRGNVLQSEKTCAIISLGGQIFNMERKL